MTTSAKLASIIFEALPYGKKSNTATHVQLFRTNNFIRFVEGKFIVFNNVKKWIPCGRTIIKTYQLPQYLEIQNNIPNSQYIYIKY